MYTRPADTLDGSVPLLPPALAHDLARTLIRHLTKLAKESTEPLAINPDEDLAIMEGLVRRTRGITEHDARSIVEDDDTNNAEALIKHILHSCTDNIHPNTLVWMDILSQRPFFHLAVYRVRRATESTLVQRPRAYVGRRTLTPDMKTFF